MQIRSTLALFALLLAACENFPAKGDIPTATTPAQASALPKVTSPPTEMPTSEVTLIPPTQTPTSSIMPPMITPDIVQVEHWQEYQTELAKVVLSSNPELRYDPAIYKDDLCEWDILGESGQEIYVYAICVIAKGIGDMRKPAIVYLEPDGAVQKVELPKPKANSSMFDYAPFPKDVQEKFCYYFDPFPSDLPRCPFSSTYPRPRLDVLYAHINYRKAHPGEPPLVVLLVMPTVTSTP